MFTGKPLRQSLFFSKISRDADKICNCIIKNTPFQVFSCESNKFLKKRFFINHLRVTISALSQRDFGNVYFAEPLLGECFTSVFSGDLKTQVTSNFLLFLISFLLLCHTSKNSRNTSSSGHILVQSQQCKHPINM